MITNQFFVQIALGKITVVLVESRKWPNIVKSIDIFSFGLMVFAFSRMKLILSGQYSLKYGLDYANLLALPISFKVDKVPTNFTKTIALDDLKVSGTFIKPLILHNLIVFWFFFWFLVIAIWALVYLMRLIRLITRRWRSEKFDTKWDVIKGFASKGSPARNQQAKNGPEAVVVGQNSIAR